ncbi:hypothetical protein ACQEVC_34360 [Plantactinospora sp. CA-294935]|uniref:hypothetical protein n=1 Tax=Plantactinospora sp. CA-294935 TaxID=3240012 RepID=UPI003D905B53
MGEYNPDRPYVQGMQWAPLLADAVLLDTASEIGYTFKSLLGQDLFDGLKRVRVRSTAPPPGRPTRKELLVNLWAAENVGGTGPIRKLLIPCSSGELVTAAALDGGAGSPPDAVHNPSDPRHIILTGPNAAARFWFATTSAQVTGALRYRRILDVSVLYVMSGPFADLAPAVTLGLERPSMALNWVMDETLTGPALHSEATTPRRARLGELNPWWSTLEAPQTTRTRLPWHHAGNRSPTSGLSALAAAGGTNIAVRIQTSAAAPAGGVFQLHYLALEITYGEESRVGGGGLDISFGASMVNGYYYEVPVVQLYNFGYDVSLGAGTQYAVTVGQAYSGQLSVASPVPVPIARLGSIEPLPTHRGVLLRKTLREGATPTTETVSELPAVVLYSGESVPGIVDTSSHAYLGQAIGTLYSRYGPGATMQRIIDDAPGTFVWARFYARHLPGTRHPLTLYQMDPANPELALPPEATISVDEFDALPELADGWREVTLRLDPPLVTSGSGGHTWWAFYSQASDEVPWQVVGADAAPGTLNGGTEAETGYGGLAAFATVDTNDDVSADFTLMLAQEMDLVAGFAVEAAVQPLAVVDEQCARPVDAIPTGIHYHRLSWDAINSGVVAGWGSYEVQRQDDTMDAGTWETIALVGEPNITAVDDFEARVGVESRYRIRMVHRIGIPGPWSEPVAASIPAPGVTGTAVDIGVLILTSNHHPAGNLAYVMRWDRTSTEEFAFPEAGQVELQTMFDRDFRTAARPLERGGVEFTRTLLVNAAAVPPQTMDAGFRGLRDLAWDSVPYVCVRDELDNRWLSTLLVPSGSVRRSRKRGHLSLAQVTVVEVTSTPAPVDGGPAPCEGLRPEGTTAMASAESDSAITSWSSTVIDDRFAREVLPGGWGNTTMPGLPWAVEAGPPQDTSVTGGAGRIILAEPRNANPYFEAGTANWAVFGGTFVRSTAQAHQGAASGLLTPDGVTAVARVESNQVPGALPGTSWRGVAWVWCAVARTVGLSINWVDSSGVYLNTSTASPVAVVAGTWTLLTFTASPTNPATGRATLNVRMDGTPLATHLLHVDEAAIGPSPTEKVLATGPDSVDIDLLARVRIDQMPVGQAVNAYLHGRYVDGDNFYSARLAFRPNGSLTVGLEKRVGGVVDVVAPQEEQTDWQEEPVPLVPGDWYWLRMQIRGSILRAAAWQDGTYWPGWTVQEVDEDLAGAGRAGLRAAAGSGNGNASVRLEVDSFQVSTLMSDVDVRVELRTSGDLWAVGIERYAQTNPESISSGWDMVWSEAFSCFEVFDAGVSYVCTEDELFGVVPRQRRWLRATYTLDDGDGLARVDMYTSLDGTDWTLVFSGTDTSEPLDLDPGYFSLYADGAVTVCRVEIRNGIDGPLIVAPDFEAQPPGTKEFVDELGAVWEVDGVGICGPA